MYLDVKGGGFDLTSANQPVNDAINVMLSPMRPCVANYSERLYKHNSNRRCVVGSQRHLISEQNSKLLWVTTVRIENEQERRDHTHYWGKKKKQLTQKLDEPPSSSSDDPQVDLLYCPNRKLLKTFEIFHVKVSKL